MDISKTKQIRKRSASQNKKLREDAKDKKLREMMAKRHSMQPMARSHSQRPKKHKTNNNKLEVHQSNDTLSNSARRHTASNGDGVIGRHSNHTSDDKKERMPRKSLNNVDQLKLRKKSMSEYGTNSKKKKKHKMITDDEKINKRKMDKEKRELEFMKSADKKCKFRIKNEIFELYEYYKPIRLIGSGAYAVVCEVLYIFRLSITLGKLDIQKNTNLP